MSLGPAEGVGEQGPAIRCCQSVFPPMALTPLCHPSLCLLCCSLVNSVRDQVCLLYRISSAPNQAPAHRVWVELSRLGHSPYFLGLII